MTESSEQLPHDRIFKLLFQEDELTWQNIIYDLINQEGMDPWNIDVSQIAVKFISKLKELKEMNFRLSGKIVLASALLLKIKSDRLLNTDLVAFDSLMAGTDEDAMEMLEELSQDITTLDGEQLPRLIPRIPQPRKRKVSVFDLVEALEKALKVEGRRKQYIMPDVQVKVPLKSRDITLIIKDIYDKVLSFFDSSSEQLTFEQLIPSDSKEDKVFTFVPLLHLENQDKIDLRQKQHFGEIGIRLSKQVK